MSSTTCTRTEGTSGRQSGSPRVRPGHVGAALALAGAFAVGIVLLRAPDAAVPATSARSEGASVAPGPARDPLLATEGAAVGELRLALRTRGFPDDVADGAMQALGYDAARTLEGVEGAGAWPRGAWLVQSEAGRWWVWRLDTVSPADDVAEQWDDALAEPRQAVP